MQRCCWATSAEIATPSSTARRRCWACKRPKRARPVPSMPLRRPPAGAQLCRRSRPGPPRLRKRAAYEANCAALIGDSARTHDALRRAELIAEALPKRRSSGSPREFPDERLSFFRLSVLLHAGDAAGALRRPGPRPGRTALAVLRRVCHPPPPGVGNSHVARAHGHLAVRQGANVGSSKPAAPWPPGRRPRRPHLVQRPRELARPTVLILDEFAMRSSQDRPQDAGGGVGREIAPGDQRG